MTFTAERTAAIMSKLQGLRLLHRVELEGFRYKICGYKSGNSLPVVDHSWETFDQSRLWGGTEDGHAWFYKHLTIAPELRGLSLDLAVTTGLENEWEACNPQFMVYIDGEAVQGLDTRHTHVALPGRSEMELFLYAYAGMTGKPARFSAALEVANPLVEKLFYHLYVPHKILDYLEPDSGVYTDLCKRLDKAIDLIDLRTPGSEDSNASLAAAARYLEKEVYNGGGMDGANVSCIGHTHIDMAWLWTLDQTKEKVQRSFANMLRLMDRYPEFVFMSSQAHLYKYLKEESRELYAQVKQRVAEGRWEVEGAMWVEADCNLPSGESLVRQLVYGKRFFRDEFGIDCKVLWLPDVFGYSAALPQLLQKCGVDTFVTSKISWNETNRMPYDTFDWQGLDGTKVFTYFLTAQDKVRGKKPQTITTYNASAEPSQIAGTWERYQQKDINQEVLHTFGYGDGGGGPTRHELEMLRRTALGVSGCPATKLEFAGDFLRRVKERTEGVRPTWSGELYLELHRGTYTANAKNKSGNRRSELLLQNAETLSVTAGILAGLDYPRTALYDHWINLLLHQFHDIIPGSSIGAVYDDSDRMYAALRKSGEDLEQAAYNAIAERVDTSGGLLVFNPHSFIASGIVDTDGGKVYVSGIPSKGYRVVQPQACNSRVIASDKHLENDSFSLCFDENGWIRSLFDKRAKREVLSGQGNVLEAYEDIPKAFDAWEISSYYRRKCWKINDLISVEAVSDTVRKGVRMERRFEDSTIIQTIWLYDELPQIDFDTDIDWKQSHILLKAAFPVAINAAKATYDVQFGTVERPTHTNTSWDAAMFEVCAHRFADLSEYGYGVSLLNDCKYGHDIHDGVMRLTLLTSSTDPYPEADKHRHRFTYALVPHVGDYREAKAPQLAALLNKPLTAQSIGVQNGALPDAWSLAAVDNPAVVVDTVKLAEDSDDIIMRLYESYGGCATVTLSLGFKASCVYICDLMEKQDAHIEHSGNSVPLKLKPFEVLTLKITRETIL